MGDHIYALDVETRPISDAHTEFAALEPWRSRHGTAEISSLAVSGPDGYFTQIQNDGKSFIDKLQRLLTSLQNKVVFAHHATFDVAWIIATLQPDRTGQIPAIVRDIYWRDTRLIARWCINGQVAESQRFSYSLKNLVQKFIRSDVPGALPVEDFINLKSFEVEAGQDEPYWLARCKSDAIYTRELAKVFMGLLDEDQRLGFLVESANIPQVANSWLIGVRVDQEKLGQVGTMLESQLVSVFDYLRKAFNLSIDTKVINSPKALGSKLFRDLGLPILKESTSGAPSCSKDVLKLLAHRLKDANDSRFKILVKILEGKEISTALSKYIKTTIEALDHTGDGYIYGAPTMFGTYTGRFTYSNHTRLKYKTGLAFHQIPRKFKPIRNFLVAPEGYSLLEVDASGQESRLMALRANDPTMLGIFRDELDFHSMSGSSILGVSYDDFMTNYNAKSIEFIEHRQRGKLLNLAANYRIGAESFSRRAFTQFDVFINDGLAAHMLDVFTKSYSSIPRYWVNVINQSKTIGYTKEFGGRRFRLSEWESRTWASESAALMFPIQSAGASMKNIALYEISKHFDDVLFLLDLHDANFSIVSNEVVENRVDEVIACLGNIDYSKYWGFSPSIPLPYEGGFGKSFGDVK